MQSQAKSGVRTSEFWLAVVAAFVMIANQGLGLGLPADSIMSMAGVVVSYIFGRTALKLRGAEGHASAAG